MKPIIEDVKVDMEKLNKIMMKPDTRQRRWEMRKLIGGTCTYCGDIPKKKLLYDVGDGDKLIEFYCDSCFEKHKSELDNRLQNINFT